MHYFETEAITSNNQSNSLLNNTGTIVMFILLGAIILALLGFITYSYIRDKIKAKKTKREIQEFMLESKQYAKEIIIEINHIIKLNQEELEKFQVSVGKVKMADINYAGNYLINDIFERDRFKRYILANKEQHLTFLEHLKNLKEIKPNSWDKKAAESVNYFTSEHQKYLNEVLDHSEIYKNQENIQQIYTFEIKKSINKREKEHAQV